MGNRVKVRVTKNKAAPPFREAEFDIMFNEGISKVGDILDMGTDLGVIEKPGAFFRYHEESIGQGRENAKDFLRQNSNLADEIELAIREQALGGSLPIPFGYDDSGDDAEEIDV